MDEKTFREGFIWFHQATVASRAKVQSLESQHYLDGALWALEKVRELMDDVARDEPKGGK